MRPDVNNAAEVATALEAGWLPEGWSRVDGVVIIPDEQLVARMRGHSVIMAALDEIRAASGKVIKSRGGR